MVNPQPSETGDDVEGSIPIAPGRKPSGVWHVGPRDGKPRAGSVRITTTVRSGSMIRSCISGVAPDVMNDRSACGTRM